MTISFFTEIAITADGRRIDAVVNGVHCPNCSRITVECAEVTADFSDEQFQFSFYSCHMEGDVDLKAKEI
jgi:4-hydroxy-3-methylbut-2-en-1-yl diphosphate synthase IspG/GcpE